MDHMEMKGCNFLLLAFNKITSRSYNYFFEFTFYNSWNQWFLKLCPKLQNFDKNAQEIIGVKRIKKPSWEGLQYASHVYPI